MKTVSIDLWNTLIKSSPEFRSKKKDLVRHYFPDATDILISAAYKATKSQLNDIIFRTGWQPDEVTITKLLFSYLTDNEISFNKILNFNTEYQLLAIKYPPVVYSNDTIKGLELLYKDYHLVLSSNTMFINGDTFWTILDNMGIRKYFKDMMFSDVYKFAKPHKEMYGNSDWHIGDNRITDGVGPNKHGINSIIINGDSNNTILDAYDIIKSRN